jgi:hypothetical protein
MHEVAKGLILLGAVLIAAGLIFMFFQKILFLGRLPGDILVKRENLTFFFPLTTSIIVSLLISALLYLVGKLR